MNRARKPILIFIAGPNGSGKTTVTRQLLKHSWGSDVLYVNPDEIAREQFGDWNSKEAVLKAALWSEKVREDALRSRVNLAFETVFSSEGKIDFINRAMAAGYFVRAFFVGTASPTINAARVANRVISGGHDVPIPKIISRYTKSIAQFARIIGSLDRAYVYDNSIDNQPAQILFRGQEGILAKQYVQEIPEWAKPICAELRRERDLTPQARPLSAADKGR